MMKALDNIRTAGIAAESHTRDLLARLDDIEREARMAQTRWADVEDAGLEVVRAFEEGDDAALTARIDRLKRALEGRR